MSFCLLKCLAKAVSKAVAKQGIEILCKMVPGGSVVYQIAADAWHEYQQQTKGGSLRAEVVALSKAPRDRVREEVETAVRAEAAGQSAEDQEAITVYLTQVPPLIRRLFSPNPDLPLNDPKDLERILPKPGEGITLRVDVQLAVDMHFAWIPAGTFLMGSTHHPHEKPPHRVALSEGFFMGIFPVTQAQWRAVMHDYNPSKFLGNDRPVERATWDECQEFTRKLAELTRESIRLPSEAEWERACRAGSNTDYYNGDGEHHLCQVGWYDENSDGQTHPVGQLQPNRWGLYDMHGNVWEWCQDWYGHYPDVQGSLVDPRGPANGQYRILRGGSYADKAADCRAAFRGSEKPGCRAEWIGCRVCFCPQ